MTSEVDKIFARVAQVAENNPIARSIFEQRQVVGQQLPEGMQYEEKPVTGKTGREIVVFGLVGFKLWSQKAGLIIDITLA